MHFTHSSFLFFAVLQPFCIASPYPSTISTSSTNGKGSKPISHASILDHPENHNAVAKRAHTAAAVSTKVGYSADGRCGPKYGGLMCNPNSTVYIGTCCSSEGWCGSTAEYCADGCVSGCFNYLTTEQHDSTAAGRCGASFGGGKCDANGPYGGCCSREGSCGSTFLYCDISEGCLSGCNTHALSTSPTTKAKPNSRKTYTTSTSTVAPSSWSKGDTSQSVSTTSASSLTSAPTMVPHTSTSSIRSNSLTIQTTGSFLSTIFTSSTLTSRLSNGAIPSLITFSLSQRIQSFKTSTSTTSLSSIRTLSSNEESSSTTRATTSVRSTFKPLSFVHASIVSQSTISSSANSSSITLSSIISSSFNTPRSRNSGTMLSKSSSCETLQSFSSSPTPSSPFNSNSIAISSTMSSSISSSTPDTASLIRSPPAFITIGGAVYTAIAPNTTSSTRLIPSLITISGISYLIYRSSQTTAFSSVSFSPSPTLAIPISSSKSLGNASSFAPSSSPSTFLLSSNSLMSSMVPSFLSLSSTTSVISSTKSGSGPTFSPSNAAQAACENPFDTFPNETNGLGLTVECFVTLDVVGYLKNWISTHYPKVCTGSQDFSICFEEYLGIFDAGTDCTGIKTGSCTGFKYSDYAHLSWDVREIYILQSIYGINQFFASWYNGLLGAQAGAALTIGAIVNRLNPPKTTNVLLNDILATLSFGLSAFTLPDEIVKAVQGLEMIEDAIRATPGFVRSFAPEKTSNNQIQIGDIQAQLGAVVAQFLTQISNATAAIETNATAFTTWASTGLFLGNLVFLDQMVQDNYKYLNTFVLGQALNANNIVATVGLNTNVAQLQANSSDSLSYDIKCPSYDNNIMCNGWWYDAAEDASFALDNLNSMSKNMQDDLSYFFDAGWTNGTLLFEGALKCQQSGAGAPVLNMSPGTSLGKMAQCFSSVKLCTWNLGCDLDSQCEFKECQTQSGFGVNGCGGDDSAIYDFNVPYNYLGTFLTAANPSSQVCNNGP